jgi:hypothetical protein
MNGGWLGVFIAPTTKLAVWWRLLSHGAPDSPVRHRTLSSAPATSPGRWILTVRASVFCGTGQSGGAPDTSCRLSGAPSSASLTFVCTVVHWMLLQATVGAKVVVASLAHRTVRCATGHCPVHHWTVRWIIAERPPEFPKVSSSKLESLVHRTLSDAPDQGTLRLTFALSIWILCRSFYWFVVNLWHL